MKTIKLGYEGEEALLLCRELKRNGYSVKESRTFTQEMKEAVIDFQQKNKLDADGIVGYRTWEVLFFTGHPITERLTEEDFILVARLLDVEVAALKAVQQVETGGRGGFFAPGKPAILFEGHIFWNQLKKRNINPESYVKGNENILYPKWEKGHYYAACGEKSVDNFVKAMCMSECRQLVLSARFIKQSGMLSALQAKDWAEFAKRYNGPAYEQNQYDKKLAAAYQKFS